MTSKKLDQPMRRTKLPLDVRQRALHEAGYRCGNPTCRSIVTLDVHHLVHVAEGGGNSPDNLLTLCPNCHALHHKGVVPLASLRAWKMLLLALNNALDRRSLDILLTLEHTENLVVGGEGVLECAPLVAGGYVVVVSIDASGGWIFNTKWGERRYFVDLTDRGRNLVAAFKRGDQLAAVSALPATS